MKNNNFCARKLVLVWLSLLYSEFYIKIKIKLNYMVNKINIKPISIWKSLLLFGIPGLAYYVGFYYGMPLCMNTDLPKTFSFFFFMWLPIVPLLPVSILLFKREQKRQPYLSFKKRFRLKKITKNDLLWIAGGIVLTFTFEELLTPISRWQASFSLFAPPEHFPSLLNPLKEAVLPMTHFYGEPLHGKWLLILSIIIFHPIGQIGEEFMWRGYILPRQEQNYGTWAWLVNGLMWAYILHFFLRWNFIAFLPSMLITPFIAQKTKNTWVAVIVHAVPNMILLFTFFLLGVISF